MKPVDIQVIDNREHLKAGKPLRECNSEFILSMLIEHEGTKYEVATGFKDAEHLPFALHGCATRIEDKNLDIQKRNAVELMSVGVDKDEL